MGLKVETQVSLSPSHRFYRLLIISNLFLPIFFFNSCSTLFQSTFTTFTTRESVNIRMLNNFNFVHFQIQRSDSLVQDNLPTNRRSLPILFSLTKLLYTSPCWLIGWSAITAFPVLVMRPFSSLFYFHIIFSFLPPTVLLLFSLSIPPLLLSAAFRSFP